VFGLDRAKIVIGDLDTVGAETVVNAIKKEGKFELSCSGFWFGWGSHGN